MPSLPAFATAFPASTGMSTFSKNRIADLLITLIWGSPSAIKGGLNGLGSKAYLYTSPRNAARNGTSFVA